MSAIIGSMTALKFVNSDATPKTVVLSIARKRYSVFLMRRDLDVTVTPAAMRLFIRANWRLVTAYAHAIHDAEDKP